MTKLKDIFKSRLEDIVLPHGDIGLPGLVIGFHAYAPKPRVLVKWTNNQISRLPEKKLRTVDKK